MPQTATLQVTLSTEEIEFIRAQVAHGEFSSESEVLATGLVRLKDEMTDRRRWEQEVLLPTLDHLEANPTSAISIEEVIEHLAQRRLQRLKVG